MALADIIDLFRGDTWANVLSGLGVKGRDRRRETTVDVDIVTEEEARAYWQTDFLAKKCIEMQPETAFRDGGFSISVKNDADAKLGEQMHARLEDLDVVPQFVQGAKYERAYGGCGFFPVINDGAQNYSQPLNEKNVMTCKAVHLFEPRELEVASWYDTLDDKKYRKPKTYRLQPVGGVTNRGDEIHESRLVILPGIVISNDRTTSDRNGWGENALTVAKQTLADFGMSMGAIFAALDNFSQGVLKLDGLADMMAVDNGKKVKERLVMMDQAKSILRSMVLSEKDSYERKDISFAGVSDMMGLAMNIVSAAFGIPVALAFGMEPAGMNATGAFDIRSWYDHCANVRSARYTAPLSRLIKLTTILPKDGPCKGVEPAQWSTEWKPLWQQSDKEREESRKMRTDNDVALIDAGIASADEIRNARYGGDTYSYELQLTGAAPEQEQLNPAHAALLEQQLGKRPRTPQNTNEPPDDVRAAIEAALA